MSGVARRVRFRATVLSLLFVQSMSGPAVNAQAGFGSMTFYATAAAPVALEPADLDGDGDLDFVVLHATSLRVFNNNGVGSFSSVDSTGLWAGAMAHDLAVADMDGDNDTDLLLAMSGLGANGFPDGTGRVGVLLNRGDGIFAPATTYAASGSTHSITRGDLDGNGTVDAASTGVSFRATVFLNSGNAVLSKQVPDYGNGYTSTAITTGDLDRDGDFDIAFANPGISNITVLLNPGDGRFGPYTFYDAGDNCNDIAIADVDRDGDADLVTANYYSRNVSVLLNAGDGTFGAETTYPAGSFPMNLVAANLDTDNWVDLAVVDRDGNTLSILTNRGNGTFGPPTAVSVGQTPTEVETGDFDGDLRADLIVLNSGSRNVGVLLASGIGSPPPPPPPSVRIDLRVAGKTDRPRTANLQWTGATAKTVSIVRNGVTVAATPNDGQYTATASQRGTYRYRVCQKGPVVCSNEVTVTFSR
jgi:hypothetical protein